MQGTRKRPLLVCATAAQKPALKGEVAMSDSELTEGLHRGCSFFRQPLSRHAATAPRPGSLLVQCKHIVQCRTPRGAIVSMGLRGVQGGLRGEIEIFPGPLQKSITSSLLFPAPSASLQGRWQRGCRGCRGRSLRPRRWRAPVRRLPACRRLRISPYRVCPFR